MKSFNTVSRFKKDFESHLKSTAIQGINNIKSELAKRGQNINASYSIKGNKIRFTVESRSEKIETEKLPEKETTKIKEVLGPIPIEMLNQEISQQSPISTSAIDKAMKRTQDTLKRKMDRTIKDLY